MSVVHLAKSTHNVTNTTTEIWCEAAEWRPRETTDDPDVCNCMDCLGEAHKFGQQAKRQALRLHKAATGAEMDTAWKELAQTIANAELKYSDK